MTATIKNTARQLCGSLMLLLLLAACGQSGPLYLPGNPSEVQSLPTQLPETPPPEEEAEEDEDVRQDDDES